MKRTFPILIIGAICFTLGWGTNEMLRFANGVKEDAKLGNYQLKYLKSSDTSTDEKILSNELLENALTDTSKKLIIVDTLIKDEETAIGIAEPILFKIYGDTNIKKQRPYKIGKTKGFWLIDGSLPEGMYGGTFSIILNATNGQVIKLIHGK